MAADGTIDWWRLPDYDGIPVFGALLDTERGGHCRLGPLMPTVGHQRYEPGTAIFTTEWKADGGAPLLTDVMLWPADVRGQGGAHRRVLVRMLTCTGEACDAVCAREVWKAPPSVRPAAHTKPRWRIWRREHLRCLQHVGQARTFPSMKLTVLT